jgi:hypothetical protein
LLKPAVPVTGFTITVDECAMEENENWDELVWYVVTEVCVHPNITRVERDRGTLDVLGAEGEAGDGGTVQEQDFMIPVY